MNTLYYGDNLNILREYIKDESVDLIYLDPPFNSNRNYNVLFKNEAGTESESQITAFEDTWHWNLQAEQTYNELINQPDQVGRMIESFRQFIGQNQMMAYLVMMAVRLKELHRVLKPTGSLYLHCDPTASHYLKILLDTIFGSELFRNEIVWRRSHPKGHAFTRFATNHDVVFVYSKGQSSTWNPVYLENLNAGEQYRLSDPDGRRYQLTSLLNPNPDRPNLTYEFKGVTRVWRWTKERMEEADRAGLIVVPKGGAGIPRFKRYLDEQEGIPVSDFWEDIPIAAGGERLGYPTQKPVALLERIISASSNEGDIVLDPFCGCGTTIAAAQKLGREWIGIDITHLSVGLQKLRLKDSFGLLPMGTGRRVGSPHVSKGSSQPAETVVNRDAPASEPGHNTPDSETGALTNVRATETEVTGYYKVVGQPEDLEGAKELAARDKYGFQWWVLPLIGAKAFGSEAGKKEGKKGADKGVDGLIVFTDDNSGKAKKVIVSVKGGGVNVAQVRDLAHVVDREKAAIGVFLTLEPPTKPMLEEAVGEGFYHSPGWNKDYPKIQILTVEELLGGKTVQLPPNIDTFKKAAKVGDAGNDQGSLGFEQ